MFRTSTLTRSLLAVALIGVTACGGDDDDEGPLDPADATLLTSGTEVTALAGAEGSRRLYKIVVPAGQALLTITTELGEGDVDLYVRHGAVPTTGGSNCISNDIDNDEFCEETNPVAGDWYILLLGWEDYSGVTLTATYTPPDDVIPPTAGK